MENHKIFRFLDGVYTKLVIQRFGIFLKYTNVLATQNIWPLDGNEIGAVEYFCSLTVSCYVNSLVEASTSHIMMLYSSII